LAALAVIGIATLAGAIGGAVGYYASTKVTGETFDKTSFKVATIGGGLTAGAATAVGLLGGGPVGFLATMGAGGTAQYVVDRKLHGDPVDPFKLEDQIMLGGTFAAGAIGGAIGGQTTSSFVTGGLKSMAIEFGKQTYAQTAKQAGRMFLQELIDEAVVSAVKSSISTFVTSFANTVAENIRKKTLKRLIEQ